MVTVRFHKSIQKFTGGIASHTFIEEMTYIDLVRACWGLFPDLEKAFINCARKINQEEFVFISKNRCVKSEELPFPISSEEIVLCPLIFGAGSKGLQIGIAVAMVALAFATGGVSISTFSASSGYLSGAAAASSTITVITTTTFGQLLLGIAGSLMLSALQPPPNFAQPDATASPDSGARRNNDVFEGLTNTTSQQYPVALNYGEVRTGGQLISGFIKTTSHSKDDVIQVEDYF